MHPNCEYNHKLACADEYNGNKFYGGVPLPATWQDHSGCEFCQIYRDFITKKHGLHPDNRKGSSSADPETQYAFTLMYPPGVKPLKTLQEQADLLMRYGTTNAPCEYACRFAYVTEHSENGIEHIQGVYQTPSGRRISQKMFKRYTKCEGYPNGYWDEKVKLGQGHKGGYHQKVRHGQSYEGYLEKEGVVIKSKSPV